MEKLTKMPLTSPPRPASTPIQPGAILSLADLCGSDRYHVERACRAATQVAYLGDHIVLARVLARYKAFLDPRDRGFAAHLMLDGYWEMWLTQFFARSLEAGMHVVDVGANFGYYSLLMADLVGPSGSVVAVEPNPAAVEMLTRSLELNGFASRSTVIAAAAGAEDGVGKLTVPEGEPKNATVAVGNSATEGEAVAIRSLDAILADAPRVDFLKIDTEGAEEDVTLGLSQTIARWRPRIILEFNPGRCRDPQGLLARLRNAYPVLRLLGYNAEVTPAGDAELLDPTNSEDRLLYLEPASTP